MKKFSLLFPASLLVFFTMAQKFKDKEFYKPYAVSKVQGKTVIAAEVKTILYNNYLGSDVAAEKHTDAHAKPEYLVYELFKAMKNGDLGSISKLYDSSFHASAFDANRMETMTRAYTDIKFVSKFFNGDKLIVRYDLFSSASSYPYFAAVVRQSNQYYLTTDINLSDPFNVAGSYSPYNLFDKGSEAVPVRGMTPFYFVNRDNGVFSASQKPPEDYTCIYFAFEYYKKNASGTEIGFIKKIQTSVQKDSSSLSAFLAAKDLPLLNQTYYSSLFGEIMDIFRSGKTIVPLAVLKTTEASIVYFRYFIEGNNSYIGSVIIKEISGKTYLSLRLTDPDVSNLLLNVYVREAVQNFMQHKEPS